MKHGFDVIGDVHGCSKTLKALLQSLGYRKKNGRYQHNLRKAIFLGDLIDGGPGQAETIDIVRHMHEREEAQCIMGNHEFNAIAFYTPNARGGYLRPRTDQIRHQHAAFLLEHETDLRLWQETIDWFKTLPLWLEEAGFRVIHACWSPVSFDLISHYPNRGQLLSDSLLVDASEKGHTTFHAVETLLKGKELDLPEGYAFRDKYDIDRKSIRVCWWDSTADTYFKAFLGPAQWHDKIPHLPIDPSIFCPYAVGEKPLFFGHYWRSGQPEPLGSNIACLDYSVARPQGQLVAYRWSGEKLLDKRHFVAEARID